MIIINKVSIRTRVRSITIVRRNDDGPEFVAININRVDATHPTRRLRERTYTLIKGQSLGLTFQNLFLDPRESLELDWDTYGCEISANSIMCEEVSQVATNTFGLYSSGVTSFIGNVPFSITNSPVFAYAESVSHSSSLPREPEVVQAQSPPENSNINRRIKGVVDRLDT